MIQCLKFIVLLTFLPLISFCQNSLVNHEHIDKINWQETPGIYYLPQSHATLSLPEGI